MNPPYPPPVDQLLTLDMPDIHGVRDYVALGLRPEHIPDLIRLATDELLRWGEDSEEPALWGLIHLWNEKIEAHKQAKVLVGTRQIARPEEKKRRRRRKK